MAKILTFANQKGGVNKTSIAVNVADGLNKAGLKTLLIDIDPQSNATTAFGADSSLGSLEDIINGDKEPREVVQSTPLGDIIPGSVNLSGQELLLQGKPIAYRLLFSIIDELSADYSFIVIDTPPTLGLYLQNALVVSNYVLIPFNSDAYSRNGIEQLVATVKDAKRAGAKLEIAGMIWSRYDAREKKTITSCLDDLSEIQEKYGIPLLDTKIRTDNTVKNVVDETVAKGIGISLYDYAPSSKAAEDYIELIKEILKL